MPSVPIIRDVKWKSPWYVNPLTSRTTVSPSCSNFSVLLTLIFLELISNTNTLGADLKLTGCIIAEKQWGHFSWVSCSKDPSHLQVDFGVSSFSYNTSSILSSMYGSEYSQLVHSGLGGVGHCFAWHVRVNLSFYFSFKIEVLVHSGLCGM